MTMSHAIHRVRSFEIVGPFTVKVDFDDGVSRTIDFRPVLQGELYGPLCDPELFNRLEIDPEVHTLVWPNGADFDPATLHNWPDLGQAFAAMEKRWAGLAPEPSEAAG